MPELDAKRQALNAKRRPACRQAGFSYIETLLSVFLVMAILSILFATSGTYRHSRTSYLRTMAAKIASGEIERLKTLDYSALPATSSFTDPDLAKLPAGSAQRTMSSFESSSKIKQASVKVSWSENNGAREILMDTLIYENGI